MSIEIKQQIQNAIFAFSNGDFKSNAEKLLNVLGYRSTKKANINLDSLKERAKKRNLENISYANWHEIKSANLIFQLTGEEIGNQNSLFNVLDEHLIQSYLFFAIELKADVYTRSLLSSITRFINRLYDMPVMILFKYGQTLTFSIINRRLHKRDESKDVLEKVTLIKDINFNKTHRAHIEILFDLSIDELYHNHSFTNFVQLHEAWQKTLDLKILNDRFFKELTNWHFC